MLLNIGRFEQYASQIKNLRLDFRRFYKIQLNTHRLGFDQCNLFCETDLDFSLTRLD